MLRRDLLEQFKPFRGHTVFQHDKTSGIAARLRHAFNIAGSDRIDDVGEHNRYGAGRLQHRRHDRSAAYHDRIRRDRNDFVDVFANIFGFA